MSNEKLYINGEEKEPIRKLKIPPEIDWEKIVMEKQAEQVEQAKEEK